MNPALLHRVNYLQQLFRSAQVAIVGGYHFGNLGDIALGRSIQEFLEQKDISSDLQTIYNLKKWPKRDYAIIGGGAIGYKTCLNEIIKQYPYKFSKIAFFGVDFNEEKYSLEIIEMLQKAAFISTRSKLQAENLSFITNRNDIVNFPDLSFSYRIPAFELARNKTINDSIGKSRLIINILPLYGKIINNKVQPIDQYRKERPDVYANFDLIQANYLRLIHLKVEEALDLHMEVLSVPFTPLDRLYSQIVLNNKYVTHLNYNSNPSFIQKLFRKNDLVICTRLHATIFALRAGSKILPIAYAKKNEELLKELTWNENEFYTIKDLIDIDNYNKLYRNTDEFIISNFEKLSLEGLNIGFQNLHINDLN